MFKKFVNWFRRLPKRVWFVILIAIVVILAVVHAVLGFKFPLNGLLSIIEAHLYPERKRLQTELKRLKADGTAKDSEIKKAEDRVKELDADLKETYKTLGLNSSQIAERLKRVKLRSK